LEHVQHSTLSLLFMHGCPAQQAVIVVHMHVQHITLSLLSTGTGPSLMPGPCARITLKLSPYLHIECPLPLGGVLHEDVMLMMLSPSGVISPAAIPPEAAATAGGAAGRLCATALWADGAAEAGKGGVPSHRRAAKSGTAPKVQQLLLLLMG
jgi:hypothetical protein